MASLRHPAKDYVLKPHREEVALPQRPEEREAEVLEVSLAPPRQRARSCRQGDDLADRAAAVHFLNEGDLGGIEAQSPVRPEDRISVEAAAVTKRGHGVEDLR